MTFPSLVEPEQDSGEVHPHGLGGRISITRDKRIDQLAVMSGRDLEIMRGRLGLAHTVTNGPKRLQHVKQETISRWPVKDLMELQILLGEHLALLGRTPHFLCQGIERGDVLVAIAAGHTGHDGAFEDLADRDELVQIAGDDPIILALLNTNLEDKSIREGVKREVADECTDTMPGLNDADCLQGAHRLAHGRTAHPDPTGQLAFGRQGISGTQLVVDDELFDAILRRFVQELST